MDQRTLLEHRLRGEELSMVRSLKEKDWFLKETRRVQSADYKGRVTFTPLPFWLVNRNRLVKHRVDGPYAGSGYCGRNFPLIQRCLHLSKRADQIRALMVGNCQSSPPFELPRPRGILCKLSATKSTKILIPRKKDAVDGIH